MSQLWIYITTHAIVPTRVWNIFVKATGNPVKLHIPLFCHDLFGGIYIQDPNNKKYLVFGGYVFFCFFSSTWNFEVAPRGWQLRSPNSETFLQFLSSEDWLTFWGVGVGVWGRKNRKTGGEVSFLSWWIQRITGKHRKNRGENENGWREIVYNNLLLYWVWPTYL